MALVPLSVAYLTNRREPRFLWFRDSLAREAAGAGLDVQLIVVDHYCAERPLLLPDGTIHVPPKPTVWCGPHRLTSRDYFAAANARNTALCLARHPHVAFVDDLSVLMPGWGEAAREACAGSHVVCGAYRKVRGLVVDRGAVVAWEHHLIGIDSRWRGGSPRFTPTTGQHCFGCSLVCPTEALLSVNGWDENCDSVGGEDYCTGLRMQNKDWKLIYDRQLLSWESEEDHHVEPPFLRLDKGVSPNDKSHRLMNMAWITNWAPNYFGEGGIRALRERVLAGEPFPVVGIPEHDWYDGQPLREM